MAAAGQEGRKGRQISCRTPDNHPQLGTSSAYAPLTDRKAINPMATGRVLRSMALFELSQAAQQRRDRQPLSEHGEGDDGKRDSDNRVVVRDVFW
jgi:hypothetical protein